MAFGSGSQVSIGYVAESTYGTTPGTAAFKAFRATACSLNLERSTIESAELRADRMITDLRLGIKRCTGDLEGECSVGAFDDFMEAATGGAWTTNVLKAGTAQKSFNIEEQIGNLTSTKFKLFKGMVVDKMAFSLKPNKLAEMKFSFLGQDMVTASSTADTVGGYDSATAEAPLSANAASTVINEGGSPVASVTGVDFTLDNQGKALEVIGSDKNAGINWGRSKITGTLTAFFADQVLFNKFVNETPSSLSIYLTANTKSYTILLPKILYTGGKEDVSNEDALQISMPFQGLYDGTTEMTNIKVTRVP